MLPPDARALVAKPCFLVVGLLLFLSTQSFIPLLGQNPSQQPHQIRVGVALVQTDVMVFDGDNRFVDNVKQEQFQLLADGKAQPISFFDLIYTGTPQDEEVWAKMDRTATVSPAARMTTPTRVGRNILFFVDDWHLSAESMRRAQAALKNLIESIGVNDQAAIVTASGQLGFLQQFTNDKAVLGAAVAKLAGGSVVEDLEWPPMNEAQAARIVQGDTSLENYYVDAWQRQRAPDTQTKGLARMFIQARAKNLAQVSAGVAERSLSALRDYVRSAAALPGRKLIFFLSDGFALQTHLGDIAHRIRQLTTAAANAGIVIYSLDTRGLVVGLRRGDAASSLPGDPGNFLAQSSYNAVMDFQDGLNALAAGTGGRFLHNTNALDTAISIAMAEASRYYILGWYADADSLKPGKYWSLKVSVKDRPDLKVRLRAGLVDLSQSVPMLQSKLYKPTVNAKDGPTQLRHALEAPFEFSEVPVFLYAGWIMDPEKGPVIAVSYQVNLDVESAKEGARAEIMGGIATKDGKTVESFSETLSRPAGAPPLTSGSAVLKYIRKYYLEPGLYQIRIAARDPVTGELGSAWQWIQVPAKETGRIWLSSIFLREQSAGSAPDGVILNLEAISSARFSIQRRFAPSSEVKFYINLNNATGTNLQIRTAIFQGNQPIAQTPPQAITASPTNNDQQTLPLSGRLSLGDLAPGSYTFEVAITDSHTNTQFIERIAFAVEKK
jgi:VWFA-related protein